MKHPLLVSFPSSRSCRSLWVGNITLEVTERDVLSLFEMSVVAGLGGAVLVALDMEDSSEALRFHGYRAGEIESVRVLHKRSCAFVNFKNANMAVRALERLQVSGR